MIYPNKKDIKVIEIQNNFTRKLFLRCIGLSCSLASEWEEQNKQVGLYSLKSRRNINLMMLYKSLTGGVSTDLTDTVSFSTSRTRNGGLVLRGAVAKRQTRSNFFCSRVFHKYRILIKKSLFLLPPRSLRSFLTKERCVVEA